LQLGIDQRLKSKPSPTLSGDIDPIVLVTEYTSWRHELSYNHFSVTNSFHTRCAIKTSGSERRAWEEAQEAQQRDSKATEQDSFT